MQDPATLQLLFDCYCAATPPQSSRVLEALLLFSSVRRSLFASDAERIRFLGHLLELVRTSFNRLFRGVNRLCGTSLELVRTSFNRLFRGVNRLCGTSLELVRTSKSHCAL